MPVFVLIYLLIIGFTKTIAKDHFGKPSGQEILYKIADNDEDGEYQEGAYYTYNFAKGDSLILSKILMDYAEAWLTINNQYVILKRSKIMNLDSNRALIEEKKFTNQELAIGGQYNKQLNKVYFLLRKGGSANYTIGLYAFDVANRYIVQVMDNLDIGYEGGEEPFKTLFFISKSKLLIENYNYQFLEVDLTCKITKKLVIDDRETGRLAGISQNKNGLVYLKYAGDDKLGMHYKLMQYDFQKQSRSELVKDIANIEWKSNSVRLFSDPACDSFCLQVGSKVYLYEDQLLQEIPVKFTEILAYRNNILLYQNSSSEVTAYSLSKKD